MKKYFFILTGIFLLHSCLDEIELKNQRFETKAVIIQGRLVQGNPSSIEVNIQRIGDYDRSEAANYVVGAKVKAINNTSGASLDLTEDRNKLVYRINIPVTNAFKVLNGNAYQIEAELPDGRKFKSAAEVLYNVPKMDSLYYTQEILTLPNKKQILQTDTFLRFKINTPLQAVNGSGKYRWETNGVYKLSDNSMRVCYAPENVSPEKIQLYDVSTYNLSRLDKHLIVDTKKDFRFAEGYYMTVVQESLSPSAFNYWNQVKSLAERNGNMFDAPPATISSNIINTTDSTDRAYGFFYATTHDTLRIFIKPITSPNYCPQPPTPRIGPTICDICLLLTGSSYTKPSYWKE